MMSDIATNEFVSVFIVDQSSVSETPRQKTNYPNFQAWLKAQHYGVRRAIDRAEVGSFEELLTKEEDDFFYLAQVGALTIERLRLAMWKIGLFLRNENENFLRSVYPRWEEWKS